MQWLYSNASVSRYEHLLNLTVPTLPAVNEMVFKLMTTEVYDKASRKYTSRCTPHSGKNLLFFKSTKIIYGSMKFLCPKTPKCCV